MSKIAVAIILFALLALVGAGVFVIWRQLEDEKRLTLRLQAVRLSSGMTTGRVRSGSTFELRGLIAAIGTGIAKSGALSPATMAGLEKTLAATGLRGSGMLGLFVGTKILLLLIVPLLVLLLVQYLGASPLLRNVSMAGGALVGLLAPDWWVSYRYKRHLQAIMVGLPDALDLMVICSEAGLSFEPSIIRVATEIRVAHPIIADEFSQTANELRLVADSKVALTNLGARTGLEGVKRMTSMLAQSMRYGTPLSDALRVLSAEMRQEMLIRFETRAARLPVLLTIPMILFILPCIFLIVGGPAVIQVIHTYPQ